MIDDGLHRDGPVTRCSWCAEHADYREYHDREWGYPVRDDRLLFEKMSLEGFQSGLSWLTILRKRENFRRAFLDFDAGELARLGEEDVGELLQDAGIVRHRGKIEAVLNNARQLPELVREFGSLAKFVWGFEPAASARPARVDYGVLRTLTRTPESTAMAKALKKRGFRFFGPTTAYAFMQSMGIVNDHIEGCDQREAVEAARSAFRRP